MWTTRTRRLPVVSEAHAERRWPIAPAFMTTSGPIDAVYCPMCGDKVVDVERSRTIHTVLRHG
jgi:hypothetical protein